MKILHKSKRAAPPHPQVAEVITKILDTPTDDLPQVLAEFDSWKWPRSDLNAWIKVLNKFDAVLEEVIEAYNVDSLQFNAFTPLTKKTISHILKFERLLLENSTNRKMFNSYDRLNSLLFTEDLDVLILTLHLLLRPSQQYSAQPAVSHALSISTPRLLSLAKRWPAIRDHGVGLADLCSGKSTEAVDALPNEAREVNFSFYRPDQPAEHRAMEVDQSDPAATPRKATVTAPPSTGAVPIHIESSVLQSSTAMSVLADMSEEHGFSQEDKFELMCRIRAAIALSPDHLEDRKKLVTVRLLAIAIFGHTHGESHATSSLFLYEPDLIVHIAEVLQVEGDVPVAIQTAAIGALDALARYRGKISEVLAAVNAGVNHGTLMALLRKTITDVSSPSSTLPHSFVEALLAFVTFIASHSTGGNMIVGAGLIPLLIQLIENRLPQRLSVVSKTMQLVDNVLYSFANAFTLFTAARGVEVLVDRISHEIETDIAEHSDETKSHEAIASYGQIPVARGAILKHILRSLHRMMQSSGTSEGLRGLIDTSILASIKKIIEHRTLFGPSILPIAINIMATFVHTEPTSLAIIQEAGLPEVFYKAVETGIEANIEVLQSIPNAIGALCLNQVGQDQLSGRPSIIPGMFSIFTSDAHLKVLVEKENAVMIGTSIDELIRHHPSLKDAVFESLKSTLSKIEDMGNAWVCKEDVKGWYLLAPKSEIEESAGEDVNMEPVESAGESPASAEDTAQEAREEGSPVKAHDNEIVSYIDVLGRFLEGFFQHHPHCKDFITLTDGLARLGRLTGLPCLPYDFANSVASDSLVQVLRTMLEVASTETLTYLAQLVRTSLDDTNEFWGEFQDGSKLLGLVDFSGDSTDEANQKFRKLVTLHIRTTLLSDVVATAVYAHNRMTMGLLPTLMGPTSLSIVGDLGALHRAAIWENIALKNGLAGRGIVVSNVNADSSPIMGSPGGGVVLETLPDVEERSSVTNDTNNTNTEGAVAAVPPATTAKPAETPKLEGPKEKNAAALKHLMNGLPSSLAPFFQALVKMFQSRRQPDPTQRKQFTESATVIAEVMLKHIEMPETTDKVASYSYLSVLLSILTSLLVDERGNSHSLHMTQLLAFYRAGGLDSVSSICSSFMETISSYTSKPKNEQRTEVEKNELIHAYTALKIAMHLIHPIISSKAMFDSQQSNGLFTRDKQDTDPEYFEPHNFLVRLRMAVLPLLQSLWEAKWLISAPLGVSREVVHAVLELVNGDNEEPKDTGPAGVHTTAAAMGNLLAGIGLGAGVHGRGGPPDENRIRQLTDMGFPRSAAERALTRTHNNLNAATELLLSQPFPLPPDPQVPAAAIVAPEPAAETEEDNNEEDDEAEPASDDMAVEPEVPVVEETITAVEPAEETAVVEPPVQAQETADEAAGTALPASPEPVPVPAPVIQGKSSEQWRKELNEAREPLKAGISRQALLLLDEHVSLLFDLRVAFTRSLTSKEAVKDLIDDIKTFSPNAYDVQEQPLSNRCRLVALVLAENPGSLDTALRATLMETLLALLLSNPNGVDGKHPSTPKWLAGHLLVTEVLFVLSEEPREITLPKEGEDIVDDDTVAVQITSTVSDARPIVFEFCLRLLAIPNLGSDELLAVLRLVVLLTRDHELAVQFARRDGISLLFTRLRSSPVKNSSSYIAIILRHVVEDDKAVELVMRRAVKRYFSQPRTGTVDVGTYVRTCNAAALRNPKKFLEVTKDMCKLVQPFAATAQITSKPEAKKESVESAAEGSMDVDSATPVHVEANDEALETMVHFLIAELIRTWKPQDAKVDSVVGEATTNPAVLAPTRDEDASYACFLMQCLTELLFSYDSCKIAFLSYSNSPKKKTSTPSAAASISAGPGAHSSKHRTAALSFILTELITYNTLSASPSIEARAKVPVCNWAMSLLVALCVDTASTTHEMKDVSADLVGVRKFVLENVSRAIKDLTESTTATVVDSRYGRLLALSDLCYRLLTVRFTPTPSPNTRKPEAETPTHVAKVMLEKNYVATLTAALADVDLNYPNVKGLVAAILRPLDYLTKVAIKMSRATGKVKESAEAVKSDDEDNDDEYMSSEHEADTTAVVDSSGREETPDLYRHSALGMYGGEMEDAQHFNGEDEMDDDDDDEDDDDVDMEFADETGSEDTSDEDDGEHQMDGATRDVAQPWDEGDDEDEDDEDNDDLVEHDDEDEDQEHDDDEDDEDDDEDDEGDDEHGQVDPEMMWQDIRAEVDAGEDGEDEDGGAPAPPINLHEEDEPEMMSDDEEYLNELAILDAEAHHHQPTADEMFGEVFMNGFTTDLHRDIGGIFPGGRRRFPDDNMQIFGRSRQTGNAAAEATTHPLLMDETANVRQSSRNNRQAAAHSIAGGADLIHTIENLVGGGAAQFLQIMASGRVGGDASIRVDLPAGTFDNLVGEMDHHIQRRVTGTGPGGHTHIIHHGIIGPPLRMSERALLRANGGTGVSSSAPSPSTRHFDPLLTLQRWGEEVKTLHGEFVNERAAKLANHVILALLPAAIAAKREEQAAKEAEEKAEKEALEKAAREKEEADALAAAEAEKKAEEERLAKEKAEAEKALAENMPQEETPMETDVAGPSTAAADTDAEMPDATSTTEPEATEEPVASSSAVPERVTVMIHGSAVDITDTGIDPTFLEALPDDMREEVINQHVRDQQRAARVERPADSQISSEFLDALPPEIRAEIIQQERLESTRRRASERPAAATATGVPAEIDPASFIASLDPQLRQAVLMDSDEGFLQSLPPHILAEVGAYRESRPRRHGGSRAMNARGSAANAAALLAGVNKPKVAVHDAIQLLDKAGIAVLVRLLFFPQVLRKNMLFKVLLNLCENSRTRIELFNLLLSILQDGTGDLAAVDKSFAQMSVRNKTTTPMTPKAAGKQKAVGAGDYFGAGVTSLQSEAVPDLIAQRCLEALTFIVSNNKLAPLFFLTEHELPVGLRRGPTNVASTSKKGKGKEKQIVPPPPQTHYPIVLLLGLLDRQSLLKTSSSMESVVQLLANVTRPLSTLKDQEAEKPAVVPEAGSSSSSSVPAPAPTAEVPPAAEPSSDTPAIPAVSTTTTAEPAAATTTTTPAKDAVDTPDDKVLLAKPPQIPQPVLRFIVNILTTGECSGRTFQQTLALIQNLSFIPEARDVIAEELKIKAQEFGTSLFVDLDGLASALQKAESSIGAVASKFSQASSAQAKLLRVLKTIDYMYTPKPTALAVSSDASDDPEKVQSIYESFRFTPLWRRLGDCLGVIEEKPETEHIATVLLPLIESLMVVCKYVGSKSTSAARALRGSASPKSPTTPRESMEDIFVAFTDAHRKVLNLMVRNNPSLMSGSFSLLVHNPRVLDFDNKRNYFSQQLHRRPYTREHHGTLQLNVRRARVFEDSFQYLQRKSGDQIKYGKLSIRFYDEEGVDAGGVTREWFQILARQMFDANNALFQPCAADRTTYQPNKNSWVNPEHLSFFKFVGRVIGKAIYDGRLLDAYFARSLYRQLLGKPVDYKDVEWVDPEYYNSLCWILENDPAVLDLTFSVEADEFGVNRIVPLKEGGEHITVTQENKREFVQLSAEYRLHSSIAEQINSLLTGFYEVIPKDLITIFNEQELELLISGTPDIDVDEWRSATEYTGYNGSDPVIVWWWRALKSFNRDERAKVLSFATGTSKVPLGGFTDLQGVQGVQRFAIHRAYGDSDRLPQAHTCFNQIDLPQYSSYEMLRHQLLLAINEGGEGFGFA